MRSSNEYEKCIEAVGRVLCPYDSDQEFQIFGFSGMIDNQINHCFQLKDDSLKKGWEKIRDIYRETIQHFQMAEPTFLSQVIHKSADLAIEDFKKSKTYSILLILTDGQITDMEQTTNEIIEASHSSPLSIIIVGLGKGNFDNMKILDSDDVLLKNKSGKTSKRDIVQFVPFQNFKNFQIGQLGAEILEEIPIQVHEYCQSIGFFPQSFQ